MATHDARDAQHSVSTSSSTSVSGDEHVHDAHQIAHQHVPTPSNHLPSIASSSSIASKDDGNGMGPTDVQSPHTLLHRDAPSQTHGAPRGEDSGRNSNGNEHNNDSGHVHGTQTDLHAMSLNALLHASDGGLAVPPTDVPSRSTTPVSGLRRFRNRNAAANPGASMM